MSIMQRRKHEGMYGGFGRTIKSHASARRMLSVRRAWGVMAHSPVRGRAKIDCNSHLRFHLEGYQQRDWNMALRRDDIAVRTILEGRPQQIPHTVRASFSHGRVVGGRVQVSRKGSSRYSDDLVFEPISPGERLMADESLSKLRSRPVQRLTPLRRNYSTI